MSLDDFINDSKRDAGFSSPLPITSEDFWDEAEGYKKRNDMAESEETYMFMIVSRESGKIAIKSDCFIQRRAMR